jgi:hypothetical protein
MGPTVTPPPRKLAIAGRKQVIRQPKVRNITNWIPMVMVSTTVAALRLVIVVLK